MHVDADGERAITVVGTRAGPAGDDDLPWDLLDEADAVYFTAGDAGAVAHARRARVLVATARALPALRGHGRAGGRAGGQRRRSRRALRGRRPGPRARPRCCAPRRQAGGSWEGPAGRAAGRRRRRPGRRCDSFGCGDSFAAGLTYGLGAGLDIAGADPSEGARAGADCAARPGPYG